MILASPSGHDPRPRDFAARFRSRHHPTIGRRAARAHTGRRALVLLAALGVPALAAPDDWRQYIGVGSARGGGAVEIEPMPFEKPGESFPGSAFYYLAPENAVLTELPTEVHSDAPLVPGVHSDAEAAPTRVDPFAGPVARALRVDNSGVDRGRALDCLTAAVYYEAASEPDQGQRGVAQVILNRVAHPAFPKTVCGVVYQGSERSTGCQFTFTCDGSLARHPSAFFWQRAQNVARAALSGYVETSVGLATHYHTIAVHPVWDSQMSRINVIGAHIFFRWSGRAGEPGNFRFAYRGGEPIAAPHPHDARADKRADPSLDPIALQRAYEAGLKSAQAASAESIGGLQRAGDVGAAPVRPAPAPAYSNEVRQRGGDALYRGDNLPGGQTVRPEYQNSGQWIGKPGA